jgi:hypothetical protein
MASTCWTRKVVDLGLLLSELKFAGGDEEATAMFTGGGLHAELELPIELVLLC